MTEMVTGLLIKEGEQFYTDLKEVLGSLGDGYKDYDEPEIISKEIPYADGNSSIWSNPITIQHPMADIEIVAWDSSATVIIAKDDELIQRIKELKPEAIDLEEYNAE